MVRWFNQHINTLCFPESHQPSNNCFIVSKTFHVTFFQRISELCQVIEIGESRIETSRQPVTKTDRHIDEKTRMPNTEILSQVFKCRILGFEADYSVGIWVT
ncbi:hypothetical protein L3Y34_010770 [Caenorhabditis briggsae]|uniref:Uncharacterized protein n=1 Tax=Caenorhabditis briggsae TaxID=6238 RepID=A0AAE9CTZ2_CAEBR|nr:hypothetical protein L3Y34_010770 [Caenorhabditis briggsae]